MNRVREGSVSWRNPFGGRRCEASLMPGDVSAIVFWSKNFAPLVSHLDELDRRGYHAIFHFTITGLPSVFEPNVPDADVTLPTARFIADRYSADALIWRYDPIFISNLTSPDYHLKRFKELASRMEGSTRRCYFSFPTFYGKVQRNLARLKVDKGIDCADLPVESKIELANRLAEIAREHGIELFSCCNDSLVQGLVRKARCVDAELLMRLYPDRMRAFRVNPTRKDCGCFESKDIGTYDTCPHGCVYCYANSNQATALKRWANHQPDSI